MAGASAPPARAAWTVVLALLAVGPTACGAQEEVTVPVTCRAGPEAVQRALDDAPGPVSVDGTPLSECLATARDQADLQTVGAAFVEVAAELSPQARSDPDGAATLQLGYLTGAARRGAVPGLHDELLRRLEQELVGVDTSSEAFERGERAGRTTG